MQYIFLLLFTSLLTLNAAQDTNSTTAQQKIKTPPKNMSVTEKKRRFYALVVPEVKKVYRSLHKQFLQTKQDLQAKTNGERINKLKEKYGVKSDEDLLLALKPHPVSIAIAQAAVESAWATSRFTREANNLFGMWSYNAKEPRIAASKKRDDNKTIWIKKFTSLEESVQVYYLTIGRAKAYKKFREYRMASDDVYEIIKGLDTYSELREKYVEIIAGVMRHNNLTKYDKKED